MAKHSRLTLTRNGERAFSHLADAVGRALDSVLRSEGLKKKEIAERAGVDQAVISRIVEGSRNLEFRTVGAVFGAAGYVLDVQPRRIHAPANQRANHPSLPKESPHIIAEFGGSTVSGAASTVPDLLSARIRVEEPKVSNG